MTEDRDTMLRQIGARILRRRQELGWSQRDLARRLHVGAANLYRIEYGERNLTIDTLCKLAEVLDTTVAALVTGAQPPERERDQGSEEGKREMLLVLLRERFGNLPAAAVARIDEAGTTELDAWFKRGIAASSLDEALGTTANRARL